ncbi:helix-turn-helix domain-containing protein [Cohnella laeviribosi]|uniref:helix-turn-helix domain-containing protein n=1 Tax=Cohnella laeviribosi TaxID=380174 RepID=UPI003D257830
MSSDLNPLNELAQRFTRASVEIEGVYKHVLQAESRGNVLRSRPGCGSFFVFTLRGHAELFSGDAVFNLHPETVLHASQEKSLGIRTGPMDYEYCLVYYTYRDKRRMPPASPDTLIRIDTGVSSRLVDLLRKLHHVSGTPGPFSAFRAKELFYSILYEMFDGLRTKTNRENKSIMEQAIQFIHDRYREPLTLSELANLHGMRARDFSRLFLQYAGVRPTDFLVQRRMKRAEELLATSGWSVGEVARSVGYADTALFVKLFKQHTGFSPDAFMAASAERRTS